MNKVFAPSEMEKKLIKGDDDVGLEVKGNNHVPVDIAAVLIH